MYFSAWNTSPEAAADIAAATGSVLVFPEYEFFEPDELLETNTPDPDVNADVAKVLTSATKKAGELCGLSLHWAVNGLLCSWQATAAWVEGYKVALNKISEDDAHTRRQEHEDDSSSRIAAANRIIVELMADPQFRAAPPRQRIAVAKGLVPIPEGGDRSRDLAIALLSGRDAAETMRLTLDLKSRMDELAAGLAATPEWKKTALARARKSLAQEYLAQVTEGWNMPAPLAETLRDRAADL
jgi:hypothetical protein